jgi:predicted transcriptional regulator
MPSTGAPLVVWVSDETRQKIDALTKTRGHSLYYVLNEAIDRYLAEEEWLFDEITAAVAEADAPDAVFDTTDEVMRHTDEIIARRSNTWQRSSRT